MLRSVGIVGYGSFGVFVEVLVRRFLPETCIKISSSRFEPDGEKFFSLAEVAQCDAVILAVPIRTYEEVLKAVVPQLGPDSVIIDVATVKTYTMGLLEKYAKGKKFIATHPMFGPESYQKKDEEINGLRIVITESNLPQGQKEQAINFLKQCGFDVVEMAMEQHDRHLAETLFLTHFVGQIVTRGNFNRTEIDTVSFGYLMDAVESVRPDTELFRDVYRFNPYCEEILKRFEIAESEVHAMLKEKAS
jgi:prephenate dehydrogenase